MATDGDSWESQNNRKWGTYRQCLVHQLKICKSKYKFVIIL